MTFDVPEIEDPSIVTGGASEVRTAGENVQQKMRDTANAWQPISGQYHAPEDGQVHRAMRTPEEMADEIMKSAGKVADGLDTYADKLGPLRTRKTDLEDEIKRYEKAKALADPTDAAAQTSLAAWELRLQNKCTKLRNDRDAADSACANSIRNTTESTGAVIGKKLLGAITRTNGVEGTLGNVLQGLKLGTDLVKYSSMGYFFKNGRIQLRQGWAPKLLQKAAGTGKFGEGLVKSLTGWDASAVTNKGQFLAKASPMNPMAKPTAVGETLQAVAGRSLLKLDGKTSRVPNPGNAAVWNKAGKFSKFTSRVGTAVSAVTTAVDSWQTDLSVHPHMGNWEKGARAAVSAAGSTAGGWAGGKAGAALGASIGSLVGPVGTVVGGVAGGIIGGVAGGTAGSWLANKVKDPVGTGSTDMQKSLMNSSFRRAYESKRGREER